MKHIKKICMSCIFAVIIFTAPSLYSWPLGVLNIAVEDQYAVDIYFSDDVNIQPGVIHDADMIVLRDINIVGSQIEGDGVEIYLQDPLLSNMRYNLITVVGNEWSIDFTTPQVLDGYIATNTLSTQQDDIASVEIRTPTTLFVTYRTPLEGSEYWFNLLEENPVSTLIQDDTNNAKMHVTLEYPLEPMSTYIVMFLSLKDSAGRVIDFDTGIYDFITEVFETDLTAISQDVEDIYNDMHLGQEEVENYESQAHDDIVTLLSAPEVAAEEWNIEALSQEVEQTPEAWAASGILILVACIINTFFYITRRKRAF